MEGGKGKEWCGVFVFSFGILLREKVVKKDIGVNVVTWLTMALGVDTCTFLGWGLLHWKRACYFRSLSFFFLFIL